MSIQLSVVVPAFNEENSIPELVEDILSYVLPQVSALELVFVDDGSTDKTGEMLDHIAATNPLVRVIHQSNAGHGPALVAGLRAARGDNLLLLDADREIDLNDFRMLWQIFQRYDAVLGDRTLRYAGPLRYVVSGSLRCVVYALFGVTLRDVNAPFKLLRADVWHEASRLIDAQNAIPSVLLAIYLLKGRYTVTEQKVTYRSRRSSHSSSLGFSRLVFLCCRATWTLFRFRIALLRAAKCRRALEI
jgi:glycosyltransferase involved in cell wall biosynthesis